MALADWCMGEKVVGGVNGAAMAGLDCRGEGRGELQDQREMEQRGQSMLGMLGARRGVLATRVSYMPGSL